MKIRSKTALHVLKAAKSVVPRRVAINVRAALFMLGSRVNAKSVLRTAKHAMMHRPATSANLLSASMLMEIASPANPKSTSIKEQWPVKTVQRIAKSVKILTLATHASNHLSQQRMDNAFHAKKELSLTQLLRHALPAPITARNAKMLILAKNVKAIAFLMLTRKCASARKTNSRKTASANHAPITVAHVKIQTNARHAITHLF